MTVHDMQDDPDSVHFLAPLEESGTRPAQVRGTGEITAGDQVLVRGPRGIELRYRVDSVSEASGDWSTVHLVWLPS